MNDRACRECGYIVCKRGCEARWLRLVGSAVSAHRLMDLGCEVTECGDQLQVIEPSGALHSARSDDSEYWDALVVHLEEC